MCACKLSCFSRVQLFPTPWAVAHRLLCPWDSPGKNTGVCCRALLQDIFLTQDLNPCLLCLLYWQVGSGSHGKVSAYSEGDRGSIPGSGRSPGNGNGNPPQYSCLGNSMDWGAWWATVHGVTKSRTWLSNFTFSFFTTSTTWEAPLVIHTYICIYILFHILFHYGLS